MHLQVCEGEEKGENTGARSLASRGVAWARMYDVHMNSPPKSGPKPHRHAASFCHLFLLRVRV
jgi:hypothetical protein